jgi:membrane protease YdiL (CAAX protease family)
VRAGIASGTQITFLSFAVLLLAVPVALFLGDFLGTSKDEQAFIGRFIPFVFGAVVLAVFPALRRRIGHDLSRPIPSDRRLEVALVAVGKIPLAFAASGALAAWYWLTEGNAAVEYHLKSVPADQQMAHAFSTSGLLAAILLAAIVGPILEEILCRGFLYRAWERTWGWFPAMVLTSGLFGLYHPHFAVAFASSVVFVCVYRRTGSLWAPIVVHSFFNLMMWYPLAGQFVFPAEHRALGDIATWGPNLACLLFVAMAMPLYVIAARRAYGDTAVERA